MTSPLSVSSQRILLQEVRQHHGRRRRGGGLEVIEDLQHSGQRPGLGLTAERAVLAILIGQLRQTLPWRPEEAQGGSELNIHQSVS